VHPNIVKYVDLVRSKNSLHVVLEYMENGSLRSLCDKFDGFSESLVAIYVTQVLTGLIFLHSQGVLHRDVKGANILTTKDGFVKVRGGTGRSARVQERCPARRQRARAGHSSSAWLARAASLARAAPRRRLARAASQRRFARAAVARLAASLARRAHAGHSASASPAPLFRRSRGLRREAASPRAGCVGSVALRGLRRKRRSRARCSPAAPLLRPSLPFARAVASCALCAKRTASLSRSFLANGDLHQA
jgi:hypothetical protein